MKKSEGQSETGNKKVLKFTKECERTIRHLAECDACLDAVLTSIVQVYVAKTGGLKKVNGH